MRPPPRYVDWYDAESDDGDPVLVLVDADGQDHVFYDDEGYPMSRDEVLESHGLASEEEEEEYEEGAEGEFENGFALRDHDDLRDATERVNAQNWAESFDKSYRQLERQLGRELNMHEAQLVLDEAEAHERPNAVECYEKTLGGYDPTNPRHTSWMGKGVVDWVYDEHAIEEAERKAATGEPPDPPPRLSRDEARNERLSTGLEVANAVMDGGAAAAGDYEEGGDE